MIRWLATVLGVGLLTGLVAVTAIIIGLVYGLQ
jgi:hypothetical protein